MKTTILLCFALTCAALASTEEKINKQFSVQPGGKLVVEVDSGSIIVDTNATGDVVVDVWRKITRSSKSAEEEFLKSNPVVFEQDGSTVTVKCREKNKNHWSWNGRQSNEAKYTIKVPAAFNARLNTAGGGIEVNDLSGEVKAHTSGGGLRFARLQGPLDGDTSGGGIRVNDCQGTQKIATSGGGIDVAGGGGSLKGGTSGGSVSVKNFNGSAQVETSGGGITLQNISGAIDGTTSGGSIRATLASVGGKINLSTSGGGVTLAVPPNAAFELDANTSAGSVHSELPVTMTGSAQHGRLKCPVNGGGQSIVLRSSAGGITIKKL